MKRHLIQKHLIDPFVHVPLDRFTLQLHLKELAKTNCRDTVLQVRAYLQDIFAEAVEQDFLVKDPARKIAVPAQLRESDKTTLTWEQLRSALGRLEFRDRLLMTLEMTNALRPGELFALRWSCLNHDESTIQIKETVYPKLTFQVIRRTMATLGQTKGTVKSVQGMLRHNRTATTTDVYMQEMPEGVRATVRGESARSLRRYQTMEAVSDHLTPREQAECL